MEIRQVKIAFTNFNDVLKTVKEIFAQLYTAHSDPPDRGAVYQPYIGKPLD